MSISQDTQKKYEILSAMALLNKPTLADIVHATGIASSTVKRQIGLLRKEYRMDLQFIREATGKRGKSGYYIIVDWGIINPKEFLKEFGSYAALLK